MVRLTSSVVLLCGLLLAWGCEQKADTTSAFSDSVEVNGRRLVPIKPPTRKLDKAMIAAAASADEASGKKPAGGASGTVASETAAIVIDASTPEGIVKAYVEIRAAASFTQMPDILVPEQEKITRPMAEGIAPLAEAMKQLQTAWTEKFPNEPFPVNQPGGPAVLGATKYKAGSINKVDDQEATVDLEPEDAAQGKAITLKLKQIDGNWKVEDPDVPPADKAAEVAKIVAAFPKLAEATRDIASKITSGELATAKDANDAYAKAFIAIVMNQAMQGSDAAAPNPNEAAPKNDDAPIDKPADGADTAKPKASNQPDPLDGTYTGPDQLRNR